MYTETAPPPAAEPNPDQPQATYPEHPPLEVEADQTPVVPLQTPEITPTAYQQDTYATDSPYPALAPFRGDFNVTAPPQPQDVPELEAAAPASDAEPAQAETALNTVNLDDQIAAIRARFNRPDVQPPTRIVTPEQTAPDVVVAIENPTQGPELEQVYGKYGFRKSGEIPYVTNQYSSDPIKVTGHQVINGEDYFEVSIKSHDGQPKTITKSSSELLNMLSDSDKRMQSSKYVRVLRRTNPEKLETIQDTQDMGGAKLREDIRKQRTGKLSWRERRVLANANKTSTEVVTDRHQRRLKRVALGIGSLVAMGTAAYAVKAGIIDHDSVGTITSHLGDTVSNLTDGIRVQDANAADIGSHVQAMHDHVNAGDGITNTIIDRLGVSPEKAAHIFAHTPHDLLEHIPHATQQSVEGGIGYSSPGDITVPKEVIENWLQQAAALK